jgi:peptidoglycan/xylan/chitin deacetylase (PgdA/CDA1 family)
MLYPLTPATDTALYFRPPYGNINDNARRVLAERGYKGV